MNKIVLSFLSLFLLAGVSFAVQDVGVIDVNFCNGANHYTVTLDEQSTSHEICMNIMNKGTDTASIMLSVVEGEFSQGDRPTQACKTIDDGFFGDSVAISWENLITLAPGQTIQRYAYFTKLTGFVGVLHGCMTYSVVDPEAVKNNAPMTIVTRKANLVDIIVPGVVTSNFYLIPLLSIPGNETTVFSSYGKEVGGDEKVKFFYDLKEQKLTVLMGVKNDGYVDEDYKKVTTFSSFFGLVKRTEETNEASLYAQAATMTDQIDTIGWYHLFVKTDISLLHRPKPIIAGETPQDWQKIDYSASFFLVPWYFILIGAIVLLLLIFLIVKLVRRHRAKKRAAMQPVQAAPAPRTRKAAAPTAAKKAPAKAAPAKAPATPGRKAAAKKRNSI